MEFQIRDSPHFPSFIWVIGAPKLTLDKVCFLDPKGDFTFYKVVKTCQIHRHSKPCRKNKNYICRFHFSLFLIGRITVAKPLNSNLSDAKKKRYLN